MKEITGIHFHYPVLRRCRNGDNWCMTWAADGHQYTSCDDGWGWDYTGRGAKYNNRVWRLRGGPHDFQVDFLPNYPDYRERDRWYGYGIISVKGTLYHFVTCASEGGFHYPFLGAKLFYSPDFGETWYRHDGVDARHEHRSTAQDAMFFWKETDDYAFSCIEFLQRGRDHSLAGDGYVYLYSPNGRCRYHELNLARVPEDCLLDREAYEFFCGLDRRGRPAWSKDIARRAPVHVFPDNYGWYSWLPCVVYNAPLDTYIMVTGGTGRDGSGMHDEPASLGFYQADAPWGPWREIFYTDEWVADNPECRLYQPKLSPAWISPDGRTMYLVFSDASDHWGVRYRWNQQKITLLL